MRLLADGNHLASRCRHAKVNELMTKDGRSSGVIFGFLRGLSHAGNQVGVSPDDITVVWDGGHSQGRKDIYPAYKANRTPTNPTEEEKAEWNSFVSQMEALREGLPLLGIHQVRVLGCEADDIISVLAHLIQEDGDVVWVFSSDKDFHQIISPSCRIFDAYRDKLDVETVCSYWNVEHAAEIVFVRAIVGNESDNIAGIDGIGPKRAANAVRDWLRPDVELTPGELKYRNLAKHEKWSIVERNLKLMRLPRTWDESFYTREQGIDMLRQATVFIKEDPMAFARFCKEWELESFIETTRW